ncbi:MAG: hypothetical protein AAF039_05100 [Bacteroidota bacterium]
MKKNHKNKFKTPEGYFESFNERLFERLEEESNMPSIIPKADGFGVPDGYFDSVYDKVARKMGERPSKVISLKRYRPFYYAAAVLAILFALRLGWEQNQEVNFENLASADIEAYLENGDLGLSSYEIAEVVNLEDISLDDITEKGFEDETILEYLDENVEDLDDLDLNYEELE